MKLIFYFAHPKPQTKMKMIRIVLLTMAIAFIGLLFILFECLPVFVKLMSNKGPYDIALQNVEESAVYASFKDKDVDMAVSDGIQDTKIETEIDKQKKIIKGRSEAEIKNYSFD